MSTKPRCVILDDYQGVALAIADWEPLAGRANVETTTRHIAGRDELADHLGSADILVVNRERTPIDADLLAALPALKLIVTGGRRNAAIDMKAARERGVVVCGTGGAGNPAAEMTWALILAASRHLVEEAEGVARRAAWQSTVGMGLAGKTLGLLGLGRVGARVARVGLAFEMNVQGWTPSLTDERAAEMGIARAPTLQALFSGSDVVSIHIPLTDATRAMIGRPQLDAMRPGSILVNTSRYDLIETEALFEVLRQGRLKAAAFDVFDTEPLPPDHPIRAFSNVLLTPHLGYVTDDNYRRQFTEAVGIIGRWLDNDDLTDCML